MTKTCQSTPSRLFLPSLPTIVFNLLEATEDENKTLRQLGQIASKDPSLSSQILKIANSPLVNPGRPIKSLSQAALNLGISTLRNLAVTVAICQNFSDLQFPSEFSIESFWNHSLCCGLISKKLAQKLEPTISEDEAFLAGLLHDIGQLSLIAERPNDYDKIVQNPRNGQTILESEKKIWNRDHTEEGYNLLKSWNIPFNICNACLYHHLPKEELISSTTFIKIIFLADILTHYFHGESSLSANELDEYFNILKLNSDNIKLEEILTETREELNALAKDLGLNIVIREKASIEHLKQHSRIKEKLKDKAINSAALSGALEAISQAKNRQEFQKIIFKALSQLINIRSALFLIFSNNCLRGTIAKGSKDDTIANQLCIFDLKNTIWEEAFSKKDPIYSKTFFSNHPPKVIDLQIKDYLYGDYLVLPLNIGHEKIGILTIGIEETEFLRIRDKLDLIKLFAKQLAHIHKGISYKQLWEKEHIINEAIIKKSPISIAITNFKGAILFVNPACKKLLEDNPRLFSKDYLLSFQKNTKGQKAIDALEQGKILNLGRMRIGPSGEERKWIEAKVLCLNILNKKRLLYIIRDVTDSVLLEIEREQRALWLKAELDKKTLELKKAQEKLIQAERLGAASEVARKVVHEVNNPLSIIKNLLKIIKIQKESGKIEDKTIDTIDAEIDRVARIIRQLSDFSKTNSKDNKKNKAAKISEVIEEIEVLFKEPLKEKDIELTISVEKELPYANISKDELKQVLINLVKNAQEALKEKGEINISAYKASSEDNVIIEVSDTGPGIDDKIKEKIFSPFVTTKGGENSGLGLSVCYGLIKACGGDISLTQKENFNTVFQIKLPIWQGSGN